MGNYLSLQHLRLVQSWHDATEGLLLCHLTPSYLFSLHSTQHPELSRTSVHSNLPSEIPCIHPRLLWTGQNRGSPIPVQFNLSFSIHSSIPLVFTLLNVLPLVLMHSKCALRHPNPTPIVRDKDRVPSIMLKGRVAVIK